ncbi:MAG: hypothetical protein A4E19_15520 [Nitrospira sp. SG-bin1]|nr:MAG: hypothetical protein A4E19_15520 [Nitrospira sp. SG-bin1]
MHVMVCHLHSLVVIVLAELILKQAYQMSSDERSETKLPVQNLILLASAVLGTIWFYEDPLKSSRPVEEHSSQRPEVTGDRRVQARLWQDPFDAVARHRDVENRSGESKHSHSLQNFVKEIARADTAPISVLALMTDGAPYSDPAESRLRQRYAVLAGLERSGFKPIDGEHIRFFEWFDHNSSEDTSTSGRYRACPGMSGPDPTWLDWQAARVPVEWYESSGPDASQVLVLWIKDQDLGDCPLASLEMMRGILSHAFEVHKRMITFQVIGPRSSGTLAAMVSEAIHYKANREKEVQPSRATATPLEVYSPWSTAPEKLIYSEKNSVAGKADMAGILGDAGLSFERAIPTDDGLMRELVEELKRRGVELGKPCPKSSRCDLVALISEWDTLYGRALPAEFKDAVRATRGSAAEEELDLQIRQFSYLRGLDGELPREKGKEEQGGSSQGDDKAPLSLNERRKLAEQLERPEGRSQLDYVRRLVQVLKEAEAEAQAPCGIWKGMCPGFKAIGVLGSDVYDKLLILQALKRNFPHVIFFTTDLDARLFHPREVQWTRNLVVASHFGLTLNQDLQQAIPPFRDSYQTASFYATVQALGLLKSDPLCSPGVGMSFVERRSAARPGKKTVTCFNALPQPRLHEIGENGAVDLSIELLHGTDNIKTIHEPRPQPPSVEDARLAMVYVAAVFLIGWVLLIPASQTVYGLTRSGYNRLLLNPAFRARMLIMWGAIGWLLWFAVAPMIVADQEKGEPFSLNDGVSIWPSQLLRGAVVFLAILFIVRIRTRLRNVCEEVELRFHHLLAPRPQVVDTSTSAVTRLEPLSRDTSLTRWSWKDVSWSINSWSLAEVAVEPAAVWDDYRTRLKPMYLWGRVLGLSIVFFLVGQLTLTVFGQPIVPFRGDVVRYVNQGVLLAAVLLLIVVIFLVLDVTRVTSVFVQKLIKRELACSSPAECLSKLQLVAGLTARIDILVYYPAILIGLMLLARSGYIDNWHFPIGLAIVVGVGAAYVVASAICLRVASEDVRRQVMTELAERRLADLTPNSSQQIEQVMVTIRALKEGAFLPYTELPVFRAIALPSGAYGLFVAIELIANNF